MHRLLNKTHFLALGNPLNHKLIHGLCSFLSGEADRLGQFGESLDDYLFYCYAALIMGSFQHIRVTDLMYKDDSVCLHFQLCITSMDCLGLWQPVLFLCFCDCDLGKAGCSFLSQSKFKQATWIHFIVAAPLSITCMVWYVNAGWLLAYLCPDF